LRVVYLGTSSYAAAVLRDLAGGRHRPLLVVTPPDRPRGRGRRLASPPAAETARELGIELLQVASVNDDDAVARIGGVRPELGLVCAFGQLIRAPLLDELAMLNVHPSLLPRWRGAAPIERAIIAGDQETGVTIMRVTAGLDSGPIALQERVEIRPDDDFGTLSERLERLGGRLAAAALDRAAGGELELRDQDDSLATYAEKIRPEERCLDPTRPAPELERVVRALTPHIGAYLALDGGERLGVRAARAEDGGPRPGELAVDGGLVLGCDEGALRLEVVQPPGRRPMRAEDYLRGHPLPRIAA
jgi:methionyl-tRNA formyltransferase